MRKKLRRLLPTLLILLLMVPVFMKETRVSYAAAEVTKIEYTDTDGDGKKESTIIHLKDGTDVTVGKKLPNVDSAKQYLAQHPELVQSTSGSGSSGTTGPGASSGTSSGSSTSKPSKPKGPLEALKDAATDKIINALSFRIYDGATKFVECIFDEFLFTFSPNIKSFFTLFGYRDADTQVTNWFTYNPAWESTYEAYPDGADGATKVSFDGSGTLIDVFALFALMGYILAIFILITSLINVAISEYVDTKDSLGTIFLRFIISIILITGGQQLVAELFDLTDIIFSYASTPLQVNGSITTGSIATMLIGCLAPAFSPAAASVATADLVVSLILFVICLISVVKEFLNFMVEIVERYFVTCLLYIAFPAIAGTFVSKKTSVLSAYFRMLICQLFLLVMNVLFVKLIITLAMARTLDIDLDPTTPMTGTVIFNYIVLMGFIKVAERIDSYMHSLGLNTATTGGRLLDGIAMGFNTVMSGIRTAQSMGRMREGAMMNRANSLMQKGDIAGAKAALNMAKGSHGQATDAELAKLAEANGQAGNAGVADVMNDKNAFLFTSKEGAKFLNAMDPKERNAAIASHFGLDNFGKNVQFSNFEALGDGKFNAMMTTKGQNGQPDIMTPVTISKEKGTLFNGTDANAKQFGISAAKGARIPEGKFSGIQADMALAAAGTSRDDMAKALGLRDGSQIAGIQKAGGHYLATDQNGAILGGLYRGSDGSMTAMDKNGMINALASGTKKDAALLNSVTSEAERNDAVSSMLTSTPALATSTGAGTYATPAGGEVSLGKDGATFTAPGGSPASIEIAPDGTGIAPDGTKFALNPAATFTDNDNNMTSLYQMTDGSLSSLDGNFSMTMNNDGTATMTGTSDILKDGAEMKLNGDVLSGAAGTVSFNDGPMPVPEMGPGFTLQDTEFTGDGNAKGTACFPDGTSVPVTITNGVSADGIQYTGDNGTVTISPQMGATPDSSMRYDVASNGGVQAAEVYLGQSMADTANRIGVEAEDISSVRMTGAGSAVLYDSNNNVLGVTDTKRGGSYAGSNSDLVNDAMSGTPAAVSAWNSMTPEERVNSFAQTYGTDGLAEGSTIQNVTVGSNGQARFQMSGENGSTYYMVAKQPGSSPDMSATTLEGAGGQSISLVPERPGLSSAEYGETTSTGEFRQRTGIDVGTLASQYASASDDKAPVEYDTVRATRAAFMATDGGSTDNALIGAVDKDGVTYYGTNNYSSLASAGTTEIDLKDSQYSKIAAYLGYDPKVDASSIAKVEYVGGQEVESGGKHFAAGDCRITFSQKRADGTTEDKTIYFRTGLSDDALRVDNRSDYVADVASVRGANGRSVIGTLFTKTQNMFRGGLKKRA